MDALTTRNFEAMSQGLKDARTAILELEDAGRKKDAVINQMFMKQLEMEQKIAVLFAKSIGSGTTQ